MRQLLQQPWPWYLAGLLIGLIVPALLLLGNKQFGISSNLRHLCAACLPARLPFFRYDWKKEIWNLFFVAGVVLGAFIATQWMANPRPLVIDHRLSTELMGYGITSQDALMPADLFSWRSLLSLRGAVMLLGGGFLVGFGSRYAGGCTSGHAITGLSHAQGPSLVATGMFLLGGFFAANVLLPLLLSVS